MLKKKLKKFLADFKKHHYVISSDGVAKLCWDLLCMVLIIYEIMSIPFRISFNVAFSENFDTFVDIMFISDILISFNTGCYLNGEQTFDRKLIAYEYLKMWFWLDLAASLPYTQIIGEFLHEPE